VANTNIIFFLKKECYRVANLLQECKGAPWCGILNNTFLSYPVFPGGTKKRWKEGIIQVYHPQDKEEGKHEDKTFSLRGGYSINVRFLN